jgi:hypothetical protein
MLFAIVFLLGLPMQTQIVTSEEELVATFLGTAEQFTTSFEVRTSEKEKIVDRLIKLFDSNASEEEVALAQTDLLLNEIIRTDVWVKASNVIMKADNMLSNLTIKKRISSSEYSIIKRRIEDITKRLVCPPKSEKDKLFLKKGNKWYSEWRKKHSKKIQVQVTRALIARDFLLHFFEKYGYIARGGSV